jgi:hypothetical protein
MRKAAIWASVTSCLLGVRLTMARMKARISASVRARPSRLWRMTSMGWMEWVMSSIRWVLGVGQKECGGEERGDGGLSDGASFGGEENDGVRSAELVDGLAAGSAGLAGSVVQVGDGDGADADLGTEQADGGGDGGLFRADGEPVGGVFDVAAGDDSTVRKQDSRADAEVAVGCIGVVGDGDGALLQVCGLGG